MLQVVISLFIVLLSATSASAEPHYWGGQRTVTQIANTSSGTVGSFFTAATGFWGRYVDLINSRGCATSSGWYPCTISNVREAMANQVTGWNTITQCAWINGFDISPAVNYSVSTTTTNCQKWSSSSASDYGMMFCPPSVSGSVDSGFSLSACNVSRYLLCCK